jgi:hypothetical protein
MWQVVHNTNITTTTHLIELLPLRLAHTTVAHPSNIRRNIETEILDNETLSHQQPLSQALRDIPQPLLENSVEPLVPHMPRVEPSS